MNGFIKLTEFNGHDIYINKLMVLTIESTHSGGSKLRMAMDDRFIQVKESPDDIIKKITTIKTINYDSKGND